MADQYGFSVQREEAGGEFNPFFKAASFGAEIGAKRRQLQQQDEALAQREREDAARMDLAERTFAWQKQKYEAESKLRDILIKQKETELSQTQHVFDRVKAEQDALGRLSEEMSFREVTTPEDVDEMLGLIAVTKDLTPGTKAALTGQIKDKFDAHKATTAGQIMVAQSARAADAATKAFAIGALNPTEYAVARDINAPGHPVMLAKAQQALARAELSTLADTGEIDMLLPGILDPITGMPDPAKLANLKSDLQLKKEASFLDGVDLYEFETNGRKYRRPDPDRAAGELDKVTESFARTTKAYADSGKEVPPEIAQDFTARIQSLLKTGKAKPSIGDAVLIEGNDPLEITQKVHEAVRSGRIKPGTPVSINGRPPEMYRGTSEEGGGEQLPAGPDVPAPEPEDPKERAQKISSILQLGDKDASELGVGYSLLGELRGEEREVSTKVATIDAEIEKIQKNLRQLESDRPRKLSFGLRAISDKPMGGKALEADRRLLQGMAAGRKRIQDLEAQKLALQAKLRK